MGSSGAVRFHDMRSTAPAEILRALLGEVRESYAEVEMPPVDDAEAGWAPWFPIIDYYRCKQCGQCLSFCLFGVYEMEGGRVAVRNPRNCKNNCPACARICPEAAIMFPKLDECPINGSEVEGTAEERKRVMLDPDRILGDDVYMTLAERAGRSRRRRLRRRGVEKAEQERQACSSCGQAASDGSA